MYAVRLVAVNEDEFNFAAVQLAESNVLAFLEPQLCGIY